MIKKKGLSQIVATVLIILITVAAGTFIAGFLVPFVKNNLASTECFNYRDYFEFDNEFALNCYVGENGRYNYKVSVSAKSLNEEDGQVKGFGLAFINSAGSSVEMVQNGTLPGEIRMLSDYNSDLMLPGAGETRSYNYSSTEIFSSMKIYSILESGRQCEVSDEIEIGVCV